MRRGGKTKGEKIDYPYKNYALVFRCFYNNYRTDLRTCLGVSNQVLQKSIRDSLIEMVEDSTNDIDYYDNIDDVDTSGDVRYYIRYNEGYLEIDNSFLIATNQVYTSLYLQDGSMLYGENPVARYTKDIGFSDSEIQRITVNGTIYFIYDRKLSEPGLEGLWLRGVVSEKQGEVQMNSISRTTLIILPSLVLLAIVGGYIVAGRMLRPVRKITDSAAHISEGGDLKKRIEIGEGKDELHLLADSFNKMFDRLDASFQTENNSPQTLRMNCVHPSPSFLPNASFPWTRPKATRNTETRFL